MKTRVLICTEPSGSTVTESGRTDSGIACTRSTMS